MNERNGSSPIDLTGDEDDTLGQRTRDEDVDEVIREEGDATIVESKHGSPDACLY